MRTSRHITCPRCGAEVRIPIFWVIGIEGIFRCRNCRLPFKTGYKMGAFLSAIGLCLSVALVQILVYLFSIYTLVVFTLVLIPVWWFLAYHLRRWWMLRKARKTARRLPLENNPEESPAKPLPEPDLEQEYISLKKLPDDTPFETEEEPAQVIKNPFTGETF